MGRSTVSDTTNIFRYKVTEEGIHPRDGYGHRKGDAFTNVKFWGPYQTRVNLTPWVNPRVRTTIELQKLEAVYVTDEPYAVLRWVTERKKVVEVEPSDVG